ncbi:MAG TPA: 50S ribosomal protein L11 methyltransferase [Vicinamibacterales bacterium]|nr:50S ribosomal protein L11 methyltransferase [Vicinamibacterales bacterium]
MSEYDLLQFHAFCLTGTGSRLDQYAAALSRRVRQGDVVLDIGTGSGLLALLACRAGASRVYAVEASDAIRYGELLAARAGLADRIRFIHTPSSQLVLSERVDVVVADIHDTFGLQSGGVATLVDARARFLKPSGALIPQAIQLMVAPVDAAELYAKEIDVWSRKVQDVDLSPLRTFAVNQLHPARLPRESLLAQPARLATIDLVHVDRLHAGGSVDVKADRDGTMHGVCGSFVTTLTEGVAMGNVPGECGTTNFAQAFFPLSSPVDVSRGDLISIGVDSYDGHVMRWRIAIAHPGDAAYARFDHSSLGVTSLSAATLRKHASDYRPALTSRGSMERALLDRFDGTSPARQLETWLRERYGELLPSNQEAAAFLRSTIERCG